MINNSEFNCFCQWSEWFPVFTEKEERIQKEKEQGTYKEKVSVSVEGLLHTQLYM